jgi:uncharacterized coiled-coil DUF342 family protein
MEIDEIQDRIDEIQQQIVAVGIESRLIEELLELQSKLMEHGKNINGSKDASIG